MRNPFDKSREPLENIAIHQRQSESEIIPWLIWSIVLAASVLWNDHDIPSALGFLPLGVFMGAYGTHWAFAATKVINDTVDRWWNVDELRRSASAETVSAIRRLKHERSEDEESEADINAVLKSPIQLRLREQETFNVVFATPLLMGSTWGVFIGGLFGAIILPLEPGLRASTGTVIGILAGAPINAWLSAAIFAFPWPFDFPPSWTLRQRLMLLVSPILNLAALTQAGVLWAFGSRGIGPQ